MIEVLVRMLGRQRAWRLGRKLYMASRGEHLNRIESNGETDLVRALLQFGRQDKRAFRAWDVGGNLGDYTQMITNEARRVARDYSVDVFEPAPAAAAALRSRFAEDRSVRLHAIALSNRKGVMEFELQGATAGTNTLEPTGDPNATTIEVEIDTAEARATAAAIDELDLLKIDAEGHDLEVIRGARKLLDEKRVRAVQFEYNFRWLYGKHLLKEAFEIASQTEYAIGIVQPGEVMFFENWQAENERFFEANYVLVRKDVAQRIPHTMTRWDISNTPETVSRVSK